MDACKPIIKPLDPSARLSNSQSPSSIKEEYEMVSVPYKRVVGNVMY
jgi:hypothetical protein